MAAIQKCGWVDTELQAYEKSPGDLSTLGGGSPQPSSDLGSASVVSTANEAAERFMQDVINNGAQAAKLVRNAIDRLRVADPIESKRTRYTPVEPQTAPMPKPVQVAIEASDMCYHWGGEVGDQTPERNHDIDTGIARDCPDAKRKATEAYRLFPNNQYLTLALLKLNDIGYFNLSVAEKRNLCDQGAILLRTGFYESNHEDDYFKALCPQQ